MFTLEDFSIRYVTSRHMAYGIEEMSSKNLLSGGGVLKKGQVVWLKEPLTEKSKATAVPAYVDHLGVVMLDARFLVDETLPHAWTRKDALEDPTTWRLGVSAR
jgi:hypothetical protein